MLKNTAIAFISLSALVIFYFFVTYTDRTITSGGGYGLKIGQSKEEVFSAVKSYVGDKQVYIIHPLSKENFGPHKETNFSQGDFKLISKRKMWRFYFEKGIYSNVLRLDFDDSDRLIVIHRHKQAFELP